MFAQYHRYFDNEEYQLDHHPRDMDRELVLGPEQVLERVLELVLDQELEQALDQQGLGQELDSVPGLDLVPVLDSELVPVLERVLGLAQELARVLARELVLMFRFQF